MKIDKEFAVAIDNEIYMLKEIEEIHMKDGFYSMTVHRYGRRTEINRRIEKIQFLTVSQELKRDIEIVSPLGTMKQAFKEAIDEMGGLPEAIKFDITEDGKHFIKTVKLGNATRDAIKEVVREVMTEDAANCILAKKVKFKIESDAFAKLMKEYKQDQARRSGGD